MRTMYDAIYASNLPAGGDLYAGYVDGKWPDANAVSERFPHAITVRIATSPSTNDGVIGDGPPDNGTWPQWVAWVVRRRAAGVDPTINTNDAQWSDGRDAFEAAGVAQPHWWIAGYDGDPTIPAGAIAKQYASNDRYDTSSVAAYWPGVDPAPAPPKHAAPTPAKEEPMFCFNAPMTSAPNSVRAIYLLGGGQYRHLEPLEYDLYRSLGITTTVIDYAQHSALLAGWHGTPVA